MTDDSSNTPECIWVATDDNEAFIRIEGRASFIIGPSLKQLGAHLVESRIKRMIFDMGECSSVDSTFLGVMAGLVPRIRKIQGASIIMINLTPALFENVSTLGLDRIISCFTTGHTPTDIRQLMEKLGSLNCFAVNRPDEKTARKTVIEAHEDLIRSDKRNLLKFKNVLTFLRESTEGKCE